MVDDDTGPVVRGPYGRGARGSGDPGWVLGQNLRAARVGASLSGDRLAEVLGWSSASGKAKVSRIENGGQIPDDEDLARWAAATGSTKLIEAWKTMRDLAARYRRAERHRPRAEVQADVQVTTMVAQLRLQRQLVRMAAQTCATLYEMISAQLAQLGHHDDNGE